MFISKTEGMKLKQKKNRVLGFLMFTSSQIGFPRSNSRQIS